MELLNALCCFLECIFVFNFFVFTSAQNSTVPPLILSTESPRTAADATPMSVQTTAVSPALTTSSNIQNKESPTKTSSESIKNGTLLSDEDGGIHGIDTQHCGRTKVCIRFPTDCEDSKTCNIFITSYHDKSADKVYFEMGSKADYVALGQNIWKKEPGNVMVKLRGQFCSRAEAGKAFGSFNGNDLTKNGRPAFLYDVEGVKMTFLTVVGSSIVCRFERVTKPPVSSQNLLYDLNQGLRGAVSYGPLTNDDPKKHFFSFYTPPRIHFTDHSKYGTTPLDISNCTHSDITCVKRPADCTTSFNCQYLLIYRINQTSDMVDVKISSTEKFVILAHQSSSTNETKGQICFKSTNGLAELRSFRVSPGLIDYHSSIADGLNRKRTYIIPYPLDNPLVCTYTRKVTVPAASLNYTLEMDGTHKLVNLFGNDFVDDFPDLRFIDPYDEKIDGDKDVNISRISNSSDLSNSTVGNVTIELKAENRTKSRNDTEGKIGSKDNDTDSVVNDKHNDKHLNTTDTAEKEKTSEKDVTEPEDNTTANKTVTDKTSGEETDDGKSDDDKKDRSDANDSDLKNDDDSKDRSDDKSGQSDDTEKARKDKDDEKVASSKGGCLKSSVDLSGCEKSINCFRSPPGCTHPLLCNAIAKFKYEKDKEAIVVELATTSKYVAFGQKEGTSRGVKMKGLKGQYCSKGSPTRFGTFQQDHLHFEGSPNLVKVDDVKLVDIKVGEDGVLVCKYERKIKPQENNKQFLHDMSDKLYSVLTYGPTEDGKPKFIVSREKVNLKNVDRIEIASNKLESSFKAHGILMITAYIFFATMGIFTSRYIKHITKDVKIRRHYIWLTGHVLVMLCCIICVMCAVIIVFIKIGGWTHHASTHQYTGLSALIATLIQPLIGLVRPGHGHKRRLLFNWLHFIVGASAWVLGGLAITFAFQIFGEDGIYSSMFMVAILLLFTLCDILLSMVTENKKPERSGSEQSEGYGTEIAHPVDGQVVKIEDKTANEGSRTIRIVIVFVFLAIVFALALVFTQHLITVVLTW